MAAKKAVFEDLLNGLTRMVEGGSGYSYREPRDVVTEFPVYNSGSVDKYIVGCGAVISGDWTSAYCAKPAKHDGQTRCGIHCAAAIKRRKDKREAKYNAQTIANQKRSNLQTHKNSAKALIVSIADGHNNPREICQEWLVNLTELEN